MEHDLDLDSPDWADAIIDEYDLWEHSDCPLAAVNVLLADLAFDLKEVGRTIFSEQAATPPSITTMQTAAKMLADAIKLATLCPSEPTAGQVTEHDDGTLSWTPMTDGQSAVIHPFASKPKPG